MFRMQNRWPEPVPQTRNERTVVLTQERARGSSRRIRGSPCGAIEWLERRTLLASTLSAVPAPLSVSPAWFDRLDQAVASGPGSAAAPAEGTATIAWGGGTVEVMKDEWLVQLSSAALERAPTVAAATGLFATAPFPVQVVEGLGMAGSLLVFIPNAQAGAVQLWSSTQSAFATFEPNEIVHADATTPNDPNYPQQWGLNNTGQTGGTPDADIDAPEAWDLSTGSRNVVVAEIDTGVDYTHPDLAANIWTNPGEIPGDGIDNDGNGFVDDVHGYDFVNNDGDPMDDNGHGTHVAGIMAAVGNNSTGVVGVNWTSSIMALKFLNAGGMGSDSDAVRAVNYATMMKTTYGVNVELTNNSWGGGGFVQDLYNAINASGNAGMLFVAAAGNGGSDGIGDNNDVTPFYPASYDLDNIISVAATDARDTRASFSNYGATSVDLAAPGVTIYSTLRSGGYGYLSGTSMATPYVSGVAALGWSTAPTATAAQVRSAIFAGVDPIPSLSGVVATGGRLNARNTLNLLFSGPNVTLSLAGSPMGEDGGVATVTATLSAVSSQDVTVNLGFTGTASYPADYTRSATSIVIPAGSLSGSMSLTGVADDLVEPNETIVVDITSVINAIENGTQQVTATITDQTPSGSTQVIDDGDTGWAAVSGTWPTSALGGFLGDSRYHAAGSGGDVATWTFTVSPGLYRVSATWPAASNRASNSPFTVLDGTTSLGTVALNQQLAPNDFTADGANWEIINNFTLTGTTLVVQLTDASNGVVGADAVRIERMSTPVQIVDDGNAGWSAVSGTWPISALGGFQGDSRYHTAGTGANAATWTFTVSPGQYRVSATWPAASNRASNSPFTVLDGTMSLGTVTLNQQLAPNDFTDSGANWKDIGNFTVSGTTLVVQLTDAANGIVGADAIRVERVTTSVQIVDDGNAGWAAVSGTWPTSALGGFQGDSRYHAAGTGANAATWTFTVSPGQYRVSATWPAASNRATNSPFTVLDGSTPIGTVALNQQLAPNDFTDSGANWEDLGVFTITGTTLVVRLTDAANGIVGADAIRVGSPPPGLTSPPGGPGSNGLSSTSAASAANRIVESLDLPQSSGSHNSATSPGQGVSIAKGSPMNQASISSGDLEVEDSALDQIAQAWLERSQPKQQRMARQRQLAYSEAGF
jgi:subtilisin family serine protease